MILLLLELLFFKTHKETVAIKSGNVYPKSTTNTLNPTQNGIINLSVKKRLFVPFVFKRKYHTIKARLYKDDNGNNNFDKNFNFVMP